jgi:hypothetical protein
VLPESGRDHLGGAVTRQQPRGDGLSDPGEPTTRPDGQLMAYVTAGTRLHSTGHDGRNAEVHVTCLSVKFLPQPPPCS